MVQEYSHLRAGKQVKSLGVSWKGLLRCIIADDLTIKRLKFEDIKEESDGFEEESMAQKFDQEFACPNAGRRRQRYCSIEAKNPPYNSSYCCPGCPG